MPSWQARHHLERLADEANLSIVTTHWPLPSAAVMDALDTLPENLAPTLEASRNFVLTELKNIARRSSMSVQVRNRAEAPVGFGENYTPGTSLSFRSSNFAYAPNDTEINAQVGIRIEENPSSLQTSYSGRMGKNSRTQLRLDNSAFVVESRGVNIQAFAHQNWWGPGWQSSLINGNNIPAWTGFGVQRTEVRPSHSRWFSWMGPWTGEMFFAQAQDPVLVPNQPEGFYFVGTRITMKPWRGVELGLTRGMQAMGRGRPSGANDLLKAMFSGGSTHSEIGNMNEDLSNSVGGYDVRIRCHRTWSCATYFQWMGEDASGQSHLPNQFFTLAGLEWWNETGQHRFFTEFMQTYVHSLPWNGDKYPGVAYRNWAYPQGFTNGGRWIGSSFGGDARILTLGWMDAESARVLKLYVGETSTALGSYNPNTNAHSNLVGPHGNLSGFSVQQRIDLRGWSMTPEISYIHLSKGTTTESNRTTNLRGGIVLSIAWDN
jgi:hypothetical protein